ncbi:hypothetical protein MPNT_250003 [Candidatus Methylacidithermus pantelleriae]|uniref:Uncharacterized protein n=1 Tax=Candidatus Methylacidithermus pantelleriae TaxID=2744239 RepID=A0A8J2BN62_9BACT|nr:hypothetical protein MPNT_250003 [Candidatus Methylacidithermus pantelleriae]
MRVVLKKCASSGAVGRKLSSGGMYAFSRKHSERALEVAAGVQKRGNASHLACANEGG